MSTSLLPENRSRAYRLGRHVEHDPRSLRYAHGVLPDSAIKPVQWTRRVPVFDQGDLGSCTGNAAAGVLATDSAAGQGASSVTVKGTERAVDESLAVDLYKLATTLDNVPGTYPPDDTGSSGLGVAKALESVGLATGYTHAFSLAALKSALQTGPAMLGIVWLNSMFDPASDGTLPVDHSSGVAGGHEIVCTGWDGSRFRLDNSWGAGWGDAGSCWVKEPDMQWLLGQQGDVTVPALVVAPQPAPTPTPTPADPDLAFAVAAHNWLTQKGL
ncbi:hypothetical protein AQI95_24570 [Streptomyces yokosukanensis]|uniref:Peptidase C1A papain C-terminal domain-containing protein n=1 Tax=Streptomyces yokosukanensis TaxID=67386 RepID=A0A101P1D7_9ACTN|nr:hypothetical protein [Streptomyces yokosukanensis]KUN03137.1 hypothetical protein AQI95_24570 [Streptomyces yokosukanensis]